MKKEGDVLKFLKDKPVPVPKLRYCSTDADRKVLGGVDFIIMDFVEVCATYLCSFCVCKYAVQLSVYTSVHYVKCAVKNLFRRF